jgi:hypothetical protein
MQVPYTYTDIKFLRGCYFELRHSKRGFSLYNSAICHTKNSLRDVSIGVGASFLNSRNEPENKARNRPNDVLRKKENKNDKNKPISLQIVMNILKTIGQKGKKDF